MARIRRRIGKESKMATHKEKGKFIATLRNRVGSEIEFSFPLHEGDGEVAKQAISLAKAKDGAKLSEVLLQDGDCIMIEVINPNEEDE